MVVHFRMPHSPLSVLRQLPESRLRLYFFFLLTRMKETLHFKKIKYSKPPTKNSLKGQKEPKRTKTSEKPGTNTETPEKAGGQTPRSPAPEKNKSLVQLKNKTSSKAREDPLKADETLVTDLRELMKHYP